MRQGLPRIPKDRIAVLIGSKGTTAKALVKRQERKSFTLILNQAMLKSSGENLAPMTQLRR